MANETAAGEPQNFVGYFQTGEPMVPPAYETVTSGTISFPSNETLGEPVAGPIDPNKIREVKIRQLHYGYIVSVGCHEFAIETHEKVTKKLGEYLADPAKVEKEWFENHTL